MSQLKKKEKLKKIVKEKFAKERPEPIHGLTQTGQEYLDAIDANTVIIAKGCAGVGKAQPLTAKVHTPNGFVDMGDIQEGDIVSTPSGIPATVLAVYPQGKKDIYTITFKDGRKAECCKEHLWRVHRYGWSPAETRWRVIDTEELMSLLSLKSTRGRLSVELCSPQGSLEDKDLPLDPYLLGSLLGDGSITTSSLSYYSDDAWNVERVRESLPEGCELTDRPSSRYGWGLTRGSNESNPVVDKLRSLGLLGSGSYEKFIPVEYIDGSSVDQKWKMIQGLMDTDGTAEKNGATSYCTVSPQLKDGVTEVLRSLGCLVKVSEKTPYYTGKDGEKRRGKLAYNLNIRCSTPSKLFTLPRKIARVSDEGQYTDNLRLGIVSVELTSYEDAQCISISHPDRLYLTDDYVVTHNTYMALRRAAELMQRGDYNKIVITKPNIEMGKGLGFKPGTEEEKLLPFVKHMKGILSESYGKGWLESQIEKGNIEFIDIATVQGATYDNTIIILDECEHLTAIEMYIMLTRIGTYSKMILNGDTKQVFSGRASGMEDAISRLNHIDGIEVVTFTSDDVVRSGIVKLIIQAYES